MKVIEYAAQAGVSPRRVRAQIEQGKLPATHSVNKKGVTARSWEIQSPVLAPRSRRPLSSESQDALAGALKENTLTGLTGQARARTASRIRILRSSEDPAALLVDWWGGKAPQEISAKTAVILNAFYGDKGNLQQLLRSHPTRYLRRRDHLAEVVSSERTIHGLSRDELAARAKTSKDVVALIEQGRDPRSIGGTVRVLRALGVRASALPNWEMEK